MAQTELPVLVAPPAPNAPTAKEGTGVIPARHHIANAFTAAIGRTPIAAELDNLVTATATANRSRKQHPGSFTAQRIHQRALS
jgi:hypothetical protein